MDLVTSYVKNLKIINEWEGVYFVSEFIFGSKGRTLTFKSKTYM